MKLDLVEVVKYNAEHGKPTELSHDQFLSLTLKQNHVFKSHFSEDVLGERETYLRNPSLHSPHNHFNKNAPAKGFPKEYAKKIAPLFEEAPYNTAEFWMMGTHMITSLQDLPIINKDLLPESAKSISHSKKTPSANAVDGPFINEGRTADASAKDAGERTV